MIQKEDEEGKVGVKIGKELMKVAGMALKAYITRLGPQVLPLSEKLIFAGNFVARKARPQPLHQTQHMYVLCFARPGHAHQVLCKILRLIFLMHAQPAVHNLHLRAATTHMSLMDDVYH